MGKKNILDLIRGQIPLKTKTKMSSAKDSKIPPKPKFPLKVYSDGRLEYTILGYTWHDGTGIIKRGWFPLRKFNHKHPRIQKIIADCHKRQDEILARKKWTQENYEQLRRPMTI